MTIYKLSIDIHGTGEFFDDYYYENRDDLFTDFFEMIDGTNLENELKEEYNDYLQDAVAYNFDHIETFQEYYDTVQCHEYYSVEKVEVKMHEN